MIDVFLSRPTWIPESFRPGLQSFLRELRALGLNPRTLGATDYPTEAPLDEVLALLKLCRGMLVLGYPQITILSGSVKGRSVEAEVLLPTEWNHIEAALGYASDVPLLLVHHVGVARGVFDRGAIRHFVYERDLSDPDWAAAEEIKGALTTWRDRVLRFVPGERDAGSSLPAALESIRGIITVKSFGRRIEDPRPLGEEFRAETAAFIHQVTPYFVRLHDPGSGRYMTVELSAVELSYDDERQRPKLVVRNARG